MTPSRKPVPDTVESYTRRIKFGCGQVHFSIDTVDGKPVRVRLKADKNGTCNAACLEAIGRMATNQLQLGRVDLVCDTLAGIECEGKVPGNTKKKSCLQFLSHELREG